MSLGPLPVAEMGPKPRCLTPLSSGILIWARWRWAGLLPGVGCPVHCRMLAVSLSSTHEKHMHGKPVQALIAQWLSLGEGEDKLVPG